MRLLGELDSCALQPGNGAGLRPPGAMEQTRLSHHPPALSEPCLMERAKGHWGQEMGGN